MKKNAFTRIISICVIVILLGSLLLPIASTSFQPPTGNIPFEDVPRGRWDHPYVSWAWVNGITTGTSQTAFSPNANITREQLVTLLYRIDGGTAIAPSPTSYHDNTSVSTFARAAVNWAVEQRIMGVNTSRLNPRNSITREELAAMLYRNYAGGVSAGPISGYIDNLTVAPFARTAVNWAVRQGIMGVNTNRLNPRGNATRSEAMAMIKRVVDNYPEIGESFELWTSPVLSVPALPVRTIELPEMVSAAYFTGPPITAASPQRTFSFTIPSDDEAGDHRFVLTSLDGGTQVTFQVLRNEFGGGTTDKTDGFKTLSFREGYHLDLTAGIYTVHVRYSVGTTVNFGLSVLRQKPMETISDSDPLNISIIDISDFMEFEGQHNDYRFFTPTSTRTGLQTPGGIYRFGVTGVPLMTGIRSTIRVEVFLERGMVPVVGPVDLALFEAVAGELRDNEAYIIRTTQIPIADNAGTVMSDETPYILRVNAQKDRTEIAPMHTDANTVPRTSRISVVDDSFQFIGQMNTYVFTAPSRGTYQFRPNLMHGRSEFRISDPWGNINSRTIGTRENISQSLVAGVQYRIHIIHQPGNTLADYSFTIVYP